MDLHELDCGACDELAYDERTNGISGPEFIASTVRSMPGEVHIICFSPLTSLAVALAIEPRLPELVKGLYAMGAAVEGVGNASPLGEANFVHDAAAARAVFSPGSLSQVHPGPDLSHLLPASFSLGLAGA